MGGRRKCLLESERAEEGFERREGENEGASSLVLV